jgi:hypothetical protein
MSFHLAFSDFPGSAAAPHTLGESGTMPFHVWPFTSANGFAKMRVQGQEEKIRNTTYDQGSVAASSSMQTEESL